MEIASYLRIRKGMWFTIPTIMICWRRGVFQPEITWMNFGLGFILKYADE